MIKLSGMLSALVFASAAIFATSSVAGDNEAGNEAGNETIVQLAQTSEGFNAEQKYMASCFACHSTGAAGAPKVEAGVYEEEWAERMDKGMDAVMQNVINGMGAMPAKGLCFDCTDADLRALVDYMVESSQ